MGEKKRPQEGALSAGPFDRAARHRARDRAFPPTDDVLFLHRHALAELEEHVRLAGDVPDGPELRIGLMLPPPAGAVALDPAVGPASAHGGVVGDEDMLPFADRSFAKITALMTLHGVNDLPGALVLMRRTLKAGGRLFAVFPGGFTLGALREAFLSADSAAGGAAPRLGPTIDPSEMAGLLQRAGFLDPVVDVETLTVRYSSLGALVRDLRQLGESGWLAARSRRPVGRAHLARVDEAFRALGDVNGRTAVEVQLLYLSGKAPG